MTNLMFLCCFAALAFVPAKQALQMFQQNRYEFYRYSSWLFNKRNLTLSINLLYLFAALVFCFLPENVYTAFLFFVLSVVFAIFAIEKESRKVYIKELKLTPRVKRQIGFFILLFLLTFILFLVFDLSRPLIGILALYLPYLLIYPMALLTWPLEELIKKKYENEARMILEEQNDLLKVGITGSFGKTSTKNVVRDILSEHFYTLMTPASYNTPMGITRTIREQLKRIHELFICEMGADHVGDITYLMDFVHPQYGILTSIGPQHLNTFHSLENIIAEKFEVIEKLPKNGCGIINVDNEYIRNYRIRNNCEIITIGIDQQADLRAENIVYRQDGTNFTVAYAGENYEFSTLLLGKHNILNILSGIALAIKLGLPMAEIQDRVSRIAQVEHRLELKKINGFTFIDNAFNSNPVSSKLSLDVLAMMPGKRVIVTPGLIDLGKDEDRYNNEFGQYMKERADFVILVGEKSSRSIREGLELSGFAIENVLTVPQVKEAFQYVYSHFSADDVILLENDLPDAFLY